MEDFAEILKELINESGLSLKELEKKTGIESTQYSNFLRGGTPKIKTAVTIAAFFNCSLDYLFGLSNERSYKKYSTYDYDMKDFVLRYQKLLKSHNISHYKFAKTTNIFNESIIRHWKSGAIPKLNVLYEIASKLDGSLDALVGRK